MSVWITAPPYELRNLSVRAETSVYRLNELRSFTRVSQLLLPSPAMSMNGLCFEKGC